MAKKKKQPDRIVIDIGVKLYLDALIEWRMLFSASSGGGKSFMGRCLAERLMVHVPVIVLDWEGEFASLREKFDMVLVGGEGETKCRVETAAMLAHSLLEAHVSAVIDLSDLNVNTRREYVAKFLHACIEGLPKKKWPAMNGRDVVILVDEAHKLCPQAQRSVATGPVVDLVSQGRKRGIGGVLATQRLSKLHNDAVAECKTRLIGSCSQEDEKRGADVLGWPKSEAHSLTQMEQGHWHGVGNALVERGVQSFKGASVATSHGRDQIRSFLKPARTKKLEKLFAKLRGVQAQTEQEAKDMAGLKKENTQLKRDLTIAKKAQPKPEVVTQTVVDHDAVREAVEARDLLWTPQLAAANKQIETMRESIGEVVGAAQSALPKGNPFVAPPPKPKFSRKGHKATKPAAKPPAGDPAPPPPPPTGSNGTLSKPEQKIVDSIAWWNNIGVGQPEKSQVAVIAGRKVRSSGVRNLFSQLSKSSHVEYPAPGCVCLTDEGARAANKPEAAGSIEELHAALRAVMNGPQRDIFDVVVDVYPESITTEDLADRIGRQASSSGMRNLYSSLRKLGVIESKAPIKATKLVFPAELS